ncbi:pentapeptide repeat-containing protein [Francisella sp. LA112445]|uniref:pentapeptide repeat-containing protein n=1 Tax=Francisella sp. LA112445 TaxID=1395624 RepID=UPI001788C080|nr:pentapeptide repeat-containing protein [Francisella sp. LA112445]QIW11050.1 hypothetical protein FIP56_10215 [Francisella sp. LA112445]
MACKSIYFRKCTFPIIKKSFDYYTIRTSYQGCRFKNEDDSFIKLDDKQVETFKKDGDAIFYRCIFDSPYTIKIDPLLYDHCKFTQEVNIKLVSKQIFAGQSHNYNFLPKTTNLNNVEIINSTFHGNFMVNNHSEENDSYLKTISFKKCTFNGKFEFKNNDIKGSLIVEDCNFSETSDFFGTTIIKNKDSKIVFQKCRFDKISIFEDCIFNVFTMFKYVTFRDSVIFRGAYFNEGLDLSKSNFNYSAGANFLGCKIKDNEKLKISDQETFRIIKHSFDSIGNHIEANKYFSREMNAYAKYLKGEKGLYEDKTIFYINSFISKFGQSFIRATVLFLIFAAIMHTMNCFCGWLQKDLIFNPSLKNIYYFLQNIFTNIPIFSNLLGYRSYMYLPDWIKILSYIIYAILTWQIIVSIKRKVRK